MKKFTLLFLLTSIIALPFCTTSKNAAGNQKKTTPAYTYTTDVAPILMTHCSPCHFPPQGQKLPLNTYQAVHDHIDEMLARVQLPQDNIKFMPFKAKKEPLSDSLIMVIKVWKDGGMVEVKEE